MSDRSLVSWFLPWGKKAKPRENPIFGGEPIAPPPKKFAELAVRMSRNHPPYSTRQVVEAVRNELYDFPQETEDPKLRQIASRIADQVAQQGDHWGVASKYIGRSLEYDYLS